MKKSLMLLGIICTLTYGQGPVYNSQAVVVDRQAFKLTDRIPSGEMVRVSCTGWAENSAITITSNGVPIYRIYGAAFTETFYGPRSDLKFSWKKI